MTEISVDKAFLKARFHLRKGEIEEARLLYQGVLKTFPNNKRAKLEIAQMNQNNIATDQAPPESVINHLTALYQKGQLAEVVEQASQLVQEFPHTFMIWNILGAAALQMGKTTLAESAFRQARVIDPNDFNAPYNLANALSSQGKLDEAIAAYRQAICLKPDYADAHFNMANALKDQSKFDQAIMTYKEVLALKPDYAGAYNNMAIVLSSQGNYNEAIAAYQLLILLKPDYAEAYNNMATALNNQSQCDEAIAACQQALSIKPDFAQAYNNMAFSFNSQGKLDEAIAAYNQALTLKPDYVEAYNNLAVSLYDQGQYDEAIEAYKQALTLKPDYAEAYNNMANALRNQGQYDEAITAYKEAIILKPNYAEAYNNMANVLGNQGQYDEAITAYKEAITLKPNYAEVYNNIASVFNDQGKIDEAIAAYEEAIALKPNYAEAYNNIANVFNDQGKIDESITAYKEALTLKPDYAEAYNNIAIALSYQGKYDEALTAYKEALTLKTDYFGAKTNLSYLMLKKGELKEGFELMEYRMQGEKAIYPAPKENLIWHPEQGLQDKHFVVYEEQGLGDIIQFCRYLPLLEHRGANVSFKVTPKLHTLLATLDSRSTLIEVLPSEEEVDFEASLISLPHLLGTTLENVPAPTPYLYADHGRIKTWSKVLSKQTFKIGICWQGSHHDENAIRRSFFLSSFTGIAQIPGVELISLHKGEGEEQLANIDFSVTTLGSNFDAGSDAFVDTAAVMTLCDLIITSDTSIAHLAGALGCQTWVALQYDPEWRWMLNRTDSPWYPTMTLYRQRHFGDWQGVFAALEHDVHAQLNPKEPFYD